MIQVWYHDNCPDGFSAAWVCGRFLPVTTIFTAVRYNEPMPPYNLEDEIYIVDFSYPDMKQLKERVKKLTVLDHHKGAKEAVEAVGGLFDNNHSGCILAWRHFQPNGEPPPFLNYVEDRDLWRFQLPGSKEVNAYIGSFDFNFTNWNIFLHLLPDEMAEGGRDILRTKNRYIDSIIKNSHPTKDKFGGRAVNSPIFQSEIGNFLALTSPHKIGCVYYIDQNKDFVVSLRSVGDVDVSVIAKEYGGGGHKNAAGFTLEGESDERLHTS